MYMYTTFVFALCCFRDIVDLCFNFDTLYVDTCIGEQRALRHDICPIPTICTVIGDCV